MKRSWNEGALPMEIKIYRKYYGGNRVYLKANEIRIFVYNIETDNSIHVDRTLISQSEEI